MTLLFLEALGAGLMFIGIIWWTMFSGRKNGELPQSDPVADQPKVAAPNPAVLPSAAADNPTQTAQKLP